jgi:DNA-binding transcriptional LysR family regulator
MSHSKSRRKKAAISPALTLVSVTQALLVGEYLSFRRVATVLGVRQSAVSRRVRELEDELGVSLFERHHAGVRITNAGVRFLQEARAALLQLDQAVKTATAAGGGKIGRLSVGILSSIATGYLRELIQVYRSRHPGADVATLAPADAPAIPAAARLRSEFARIRDEFGDFPGHPAAFWFGRADRNARRRNRPWRCRVPAAAAHQPGSLPRLGSCDPQQGDEPCRCRYGAAISRKQRVVRRDHPELARRQSYWGMGRGGVGNEETLYRVISVLLVLPHCCCLLTIPSPVRHP